MDESKRNINDLKEQKLRENIMKNIDSLMDLQTLITSDHVYETKLYKFYHYSYKVYHLQDYTLEIVEALKKLLDVPLHTNFMRQIELGTGKQFVQSQKVDWFEETVQITNAFMHAKYMLEMVLKYGVISAGGKESNFTNGWTAVLCLYNIR